TGKVTLKHGQISTLNMPPMTMVFTVSDKALLNGLKVGDKVRFAAAAEGGRFVVTQLEAAD
ncbi:MAG: copper-binding protein, partial [Gammaproteobacteria bacterium]|nr:copper-binding protein [Gammaproteobacteria bacterium]